jgi:ankyrin repeat protein
MLPLGSKQLMTPLMAAVGMSGVGRGNGGGTPPPGDPQTLAIRTIDLLLDAGADVNARVTDSRTNTARLSSYIQGRDQEGRTALFAAAAADQPAAVATLLELGADPALAAGAPPGLDPVHLAASQAGQGFFLERARS